MHTVIELRLLLPCSSGHAIKRFAAKAGPAMGIHLLLSQMGRATAALPRLRRASRLMVEGVYCSGENPAQTEISGLTRWDGGALCNAEFGMGHGAGQVLHSSFAVALFYRMGY